MRSFLLICATIFVLALALFAYLWFQPDVAEQPAQRMLVEKPASRPSSTTKIAGLGVVDSAWILRIDPKTGELASRFRGDEYDPQPDNSVLVKHPEADFFSNDGKQRIHIAGQTGRVILAGTAAREAGNFSGKMEPPSRGLLHDVVITLFEPADAPEPSVTATMNNAAFDNDAFRIETTAFTDADGHHVPADQVPVKVRGNDYDFDGRGLVIAWNERDRKLQLLEIEHGERLTIKNLKALNNPQLTGLQSNPCPGDRPLDGMLASRDQSDVMLIAEIRKRHLTRAQMRRAATRRAAAEAQVEAERAAAAHHATPTIYRATFNGDVHILESDKRIGTADLMNVDVLQGSPPGTQPTSKTAAATTHSADLSASKPATRHTPAHHEHSPTTEPTTSAASKLPKPTSRPLQGPITVRWTGKLRVVPLDQTPLQQNIKPNKAIVQLIGNPVVLDRDGSHITCASASYNSGDESADLTSSPSVPLVRLADARGAVFLTPHLIYTETAPQQKFATLIGPSTGTIPLKDTDAKMQFVHASWQDQCKLTLTTDEDGRTQIQHAQLTKDVVVNHPQLDLTSNELGLDFAPVTNRHPAPRNSDAVEVDLRQIVATGNVHAKMHNAEGKVQTLDTNRLEVDTGTDADGDTFVRVIDASGNVVSRADEGMLTSGHLVAYLKPPTSKPAVTQPATTQPLAQAITKPKSASPFGNSADLDHLIAEDHVRYATTQGSTATADRLAIEPDNGYQRVVLTGTPATVGSPTSRVRSNLIRFTPDANFAEIPGPGTLHATSQPSRGSTDRNLQGAQSVDIAWSGSATINGKTNLINIDNSVKVVAHESDGTTNTATSNHLVATLMDRPTTQPATRKSKTSESALMENKDIAAAKLLGNVEVNSALNSPQGELLRGFYLSSEEIDYDKLAGRMVVPVPGKMLYQDHRAGPATQPEGPTVGSGRGATAFEWKKSLVYDESVHLATLTGDVAIVHHSEGRQSQPFRLDAQLVTAQFESAPTTQRQGPARADETAALRLKLVTAEDHVHVSSARATFDAFRLTYDPINHLLTARGTADNPGRLYDSSTGSASTFSTLEWNTQTDQFKITNASGRMRR